MEIIKKIQQTCLSNQILKYYTEEELMIYFGMEIGSPFCNPFRIDNKPSCTCSIYNGKYVFKDWSLNKSWNWIGVAGLYYKILKIEDDTFIKSKDYNLIVKTIYAELIENREFTDSDIKDNSINTIKKYKKIEVKLRKWKEYDDEFWFPLTKEFIQNTQTPVYPLSYIVMDKQILCKSSKSNPTYGYFFKEYSIKGNEIWKIYKPLDKNGFKWLSNIKSNMISYGQ